MQRSSTSTGQARSSQSRLRAPSATNAKTLGDTTNPADKTNKDSKKPDKKGIEFQLPALSIVGKKKEIDFEQIRKKVIRRGNPEGEDKKQLADILKHLKESKAKIRVQEFVSLVSKYTCDNGATMRKVMEDDLASFRKMVTKVYENMTQDVSDVLVNEQIQTANFYQERYDIFNNKMLWMISEIYQMVPEFDFEKYAAEKLEFLNYICPMPAAISRADEEMDLQKRQEAFHRLQWLKIEEDRLAEENSRLEERLEDLKEQHKKATALSSMKTLIMEKKTCDLEEQEQERQEHLNELEGLLGKNIVRTEAYIRLEQDEASRLAKPLPRELAKKLKRGKSSSKENWSSITATGIEERAAKKLVDTESARADEKKRLRRRVREPGRETTLFAEPPPMEYPEFPSASRMQEKNIQQTTTTIQEKRPRRPQSRTANHPSDKSVKGGCGGGCG